MPAWVEAGYRTYAERMPRECSLALTEVPLPPRVKSSTEARLKAREAEGLLAAAGSDLIVALDERGTEVDTPGLARRLDRWLQGGRNVSLLIGGPDGLDERCLRQADWVWSLSRLTLPHPLVRVVVAEQCYRAWSVVRGHPYHRD
jgi:23S rRNA (pseudouridine1915-N3)-methyltransferase